jgi:hypothetical protein
MFCGAVVMVHAGTLGSPPVRPDRTLEFRCPSSGEKSREKSFLTRTLREDFAALIPPRGGWPGHFASIRMLPTPRVLSESVRHSQDEGPDTMITELHSITLAGLYATVAVGLLLTGETCMATLHACIALEYWRARKHR